MSALQLQNLATLAAAAAAAQNSASPSTANPLSSNAASLGALASPGNTAATQVGGSDAGGRGGPTPAYVLRSAPLPLPVLSPHSPPSMIPGTSPPSPKPSTNHRCRNHLHCSDLRQCCRPPFWHSAMVCVSTVSASQTSIFNRETMLCC